MAFLYVLLLPFTVSVCNKNSVQPKQAVIRGREPAQPLCITLRDRDMACWIKVISYSHNAIISSSRPISSSSPEFERDSTSSWFRKACTMNVRAFMTQTLGDAEWSNDGDLSIERENENLLCNFARFPDGVIFFVILFYSWKWFIAEKSFSWSVGQKKRDCFSLYGTGIGDVLVIMLSKSGGCDFY